MITIEKDVNAEEVFIHASPEDLREFAKKLWQISEKGDVKGKHSEQFTAKSGDDVELGTRPQGESRKYSVIKKLTVSTKA